MATIGTMVLKFTADIGGLTKGIEEAQSQLQSVGNAMRGLGAKATAGVTAPLVGMGAVAAKSAVDFNGSMANVQTLLTDMADGGTARTQELGEAVQAMAITTGKSTDDLAGGLYQVISAFGDTGDTVSILEMNAKAAAAGLATTEQAIALTSSVSKNFGDTSADAISKISDMAFATVKLGQTSFPELAGAMGSIAPIAASVGLSQEELFGTMATATGVTGSAAEVATQLRGVLQALMAPSSKMSELLESMGYASGEAMLEAEGLQGTINTIVAASQASGSPLQNFIGSVEGMSLASALAGDLSTDLTEKIGTMSESVGATDQAFGAVSEGVNSLGFEFAQTQQQFAVTAQKLGSALVPALAAALDAAAPLIDMIVKLADAFATADPKLQATILAIGGIAAAIGPVLMVVGTLASGLSAAAGIVGPLIGALGLLLNPITLVGGAVAGLLAILFNWGGANDYVADTLEGWGLEGVAQFVRDLHTNVSDLTAAVGDFFSGETSFSEFFDAVVPDWLTTLFNWIWPVLGPIGWIVKLVAWKWPTMSKPGWIQTLLDWKWPGFPTRPAWLGGGGDEAGQNAQGTPRWRGGLTWVGEEGPELVNLPRGTQIFPADVSSAMAGGMGGGLVINGPIIQNANFANDMDIYTVARKVVSEIQKRSI